MGETGTPTIKQSKEFAEDVLAARPNLMLAYNNSPSFNWDAAGMTDDQMETFIWDLGKMGYCWQFITLAGFHMDALGISRWKLSFGILARWVIVGSSSHWQASTWTHLVYPDGNFHLGSWQDGLLLAVHHIGRLPHGRTWYILVCETVQGQGHEGLCQHDPAARERAWS